MDRLEQLRLVALPLTMVEVDRVDRVSTELLQAARAHVVAQHLHVRLDCGTIQHVR